MSLESIHWQAIRSINGSQAEGFEELCSQLARAESPSGSSFTRKGAPDAGVECFTVFPDGTEWGWQAKYFDSLGESQWSQLDDSVRTALAKHPRLIKYFVCVPLDRPDARIKDRMSAMDRWDDHVKKWTQWASDGGTIVRFVYWGSHELLDRLSRQENVGRVRFWFNVHGFDAAWFSARLEEAVKTAGPRYTPEIHVDLPIAWEFEALGRTDSFFDRVKAHGRRIREKLRLADPAGSRVTEQPIQDAAAALASNVQAILSRLGDVRVQPIGSLPFTGILDCVRAAEAAAEELARLFEERQRATETEPSSGAETPPDLTTYRSYPYRDRWIRLRCLYSELRATGETLKHAERMTRRGLMVLRGGAGTGKTHILCDVARERIAAGRPTVLLMGQRFVSNDAPWLQALQQLDMAALSTEVFVGALESAAQAANSRALLLIDALNEGSGRAIWPSNLAAFVACLERSPWIGVVLSIRSSYEELIIPADVRDRAVTVTHEGFSEHEYDAAKTFFVHYELELPSTPLLAQEFANPLFLKTLCCGLNARGDRRLPRGLHGITAVFNLYLQAVNHKLASVLDFDPRTTLVQKALEAVAKTLINGHQHWLTCAKAAEVVNALLPGRDFERSLYRGLVLEGVLIEEANWPSGLNREEVVFVAYERLADHLAARALLDQHLNADDPTLAFAQGGPLAFICGPNRHLTPGLLEALCIQLPERTGKELISLAPACVACAGLGDAFRQSLVWRAYNAFSNATRDSLRQLCRSELDYHDTLEVLLTVATLPEHPLNMLFLDRRLRQDKMAERDAWWTLYLHQAWGNKGAVDRLVEWASLVTPVTCLDNETIDLCSTSLGWMLTTSNRFLRDRATKALVSLLTGRLEAVVRLVDRFADVDDPYVAERIYAVAYGTASRSHDPITVGALAACVYARVFASGSPTPHILLRDYARGVVERALFLGARIEVVAERIRPPYGSQWPRIPTEEDINPHLPDWTRGHHDDGGHGWARNCIGHSVMHGDFARYVVGTNYSTNWLALRLQDAAWTPPEPIEDLLSAFVAGLSEIERKAWDDFCVADQAFEEVVPGPSDVATWVLTTDDTAGSVALNTVDTHLPESEQLRPGLLALQQRHAEATFELTRVLTEEHQGRLEAIRSLMNGDRDQRSPPPLDLRELQRYILYRVFDLGWTTERFGYFDRFCVPEETRGASKVERIGKKYQWIAYHEIMALVADCFQHRADPLTDDPNEPYDGPWQEHLRDIDPSCTSWPTPEEALQKGELGSWWCSVQYDRWKQPECPRDWLTDTEGLPRIESLLRVQQHADGSTWLNAQGYFHWEEPTPPDREPTDLERRELWFICSGYLVRASQVQAFLEWAEQVDFWGRWMPEPTQLPHVFLGEHAWAPASRYFQNPHFEGWRRPLKDCPVELRPAALEYLHEAGNFDCSTDATFTFRLPIPELVTGLAIRWSGCRADFVDIDGTLTAQDPSAQAGSPTGFLLRENAIREFLRQQSLAMVWSIVGEKRIVPTVPRGVVDLESLRISGACVLKENGLEGSMRCMHGQPIPSRLSSLSNSVLRVIRIPE